MSRETRMAIEHSTPMPQRFESGVSARYETKVFSLWDRKRGTKLTPSPMKLPGYRNGSTGGVFCATSATSPKEFGACIGFSNHDSEGGVMATATQWAHNTELDTRKRSSTSHDFEDALRQKIVGQDEAVQALVELHQVFCAGLRSLGRPVGKLLFVGPTGSGKARIVEAAAEILFGDSRAVIKLDCAEFQHSHEIAPGYLGHRETHPLITQEALAASHRDNLKLSFLLFDEIEKAADSLWQLLLGILDKATLTLADNRRVDLSQTVIFLTSNLGGGAITELMEGGMGFIQPKDKPPAGLDAKVERTAVQAARRKFSPEFMNRLDSVVVFHPLKREELEEVLEIELGQVQKRVLDSATGRFPFRITGEGREFLLEEGTDQRYGARHLKRAIERHVVSPLARLLVTAQVESGDVLIIDRHPEDKGLAFRKDAALRLSCARVPHAAAYLSHSASAEARGRL
jgi:ATP-dependent Clp protease ATP-binding subunit ClpB